MSLTEHSVRAKAAIATALAGAAMALVLAFGPAPAKAHDVCSEVVPDGSVACLRFYHTKIDVCDRQVDGHRAYARMLLINGKYADPLYDNDKGTGCSRYNFPGIYVGRWAACVQAEGCGGVWARDYFWGPRWPW